MTLNASRSAAFGALIWIGFVAWTRPVASADGWTRAAVALATLVLVPLVLDLLRERNDAPTIARWFERAARVQFPAALLATGACALPASMGAAALTFPWLLVTAVLGAVGVMRILRHGFARPLDRLCTDVALMYLAVGALWLLAERAGVALFGFDAALVALTAAHFHFAGLALPVFAGLVLRRMPDSRFVARVVVGVVLAVPAVALGITATHLGWGNGLETAASAALAVAGGFVAILHVRIAIEPGLSMVARIALGVAGVALFFAMVLSALYAVRDAVHVAPWLGLPQMRAWHGTLNALGFGVCGALGWRTAGRAGSREPSGKR